MSDTQRTFFERSTWRCLWADPIYVTRCDVMMIIFGQWEMFPETQSIFNVNEPLN